MAQVGFEPTASLVLSESGLPVAYRAEVRERADAQGEIRTRNRSGLSRAARPIGVPGRSETKSKVGMQKAKRRRSMRLQATYFCLSHFYF